RQGQSPPRLRRTSVRRRVTSRWMKTKLLKARRRAPVTCHLYISGEFYERARESLRKLWGKVRAHPTPPLGPALLLQGVQSKLPCENSEGSCLDEKVVWTVGKPSRHPTLITVVARLVISRNSAEPVTSR